MEIIILFLTGIISALLTYVVNNKYKQGAVRASAGLSLLVGLFFYLFPDILTPYLTKNIPIVFIGATFIGMVSSKILPSYLLVGFSGFIFSIIYLNASPFFKGYGGALGTTAAISVLVSLSLAVVSKSEKIKKIKNYRTSRKNK
ncbi:hypothetical protein APR41_03925 [Salegentibacter salinarum]|uniref:Uncharacterized protein n=1 Tax=Salegentibacter salinarum TaxID=447422 RepID=A0A2N0TU89_9FLAO|nr:hypothetical protein [Salegentibacter salinarum]PKD18309.1 hypothetical protein APR41_03925 [Salegentibacter salinarum]SKB43874.1 hypothetical protein SAMN05660903_00802 [Salegentibacter salinarum]